MNEAKVRAVLDYVYEEAHGALTNAPGTRIEDGIVFLEALENIESKIEELDDDDLGRECDT
jgi:hypothetical protein